jgi:hypothetical protein
MDGFTTDYGCKLLVWYEAYERVDEATQGRPHRPLPLGFFASLAMTNP